MRIATGTGYWSHGAEALAAIHGGEGRPITVKIRIDLSFVGVTDVVVIAGAVALPNLDL
jgi:hypothetical protein